MHLSEKYLKLRNRTLNIHRERKNSAQYGVERVLLILPAWIYV